MKTVLVLAALLVGLAACGQGGPQEVVVVTATPTPEATPTATVTPPRPADWETARRNAPTDMRVLVKALAHCRAQDTSNLFDDDIEAYRALVAYLVPFQSDLVG